MFKKLLFFLCITSCLLGYGATPSFEETWVEAEKANLFCRVAGKGTPLIVIHGGPGLTQDYLLPHLEKLAENHFVIFYDQRSCGNSTGELDSFEIRTFLKDIEAIRKHFGLRKVAILGHSWGGLIAMHYAIHYPRSIEKLILCNSMSASSAELSDFLEEYQKRLTPYQKELSTLSNTEEFRLGNTEIVEQYYRIIFRTYCYNSEKAELLDLQLSPVASTNGRKVYEILRRDFLSHNFNLHPELRKLRVATLIVHGDHDPIPFHTAVHLHESIVDSKYVLLKDCGHFPYVEKPEVFFKTLNDFLDRSEIIHQDSAEQETKIVYGNELLLEPKRSTRVKKNRKKGFELLYS